MEKSLVYGEINRVYKNLLLIDSSVKDYTQFVDSANADTFPIVYSSLCSKTELLNVLNQFSSIDRICMCFITEDQYIFLDSEPLFESTSGNV